MPLKSLSLNFISQSSFKFSASLGTQVSLTNKFKFFILSSFQEYLYRHEKVRLI